MTTYGIASKTQGAPVEDGMNTLPDSPLSGVRAMESDLAEEVPGAATTLDEWRRKAIDVFAIAGSLAYLPPVALMVAGLAPPNGWPTHLICVAAYLTFLLCVVFRRTDYRARTWMLLVAGYTVSLIHLITIPQGPFGPALLAMLPILALVVLGAWAGRTTTAISVGFILLGRLLQRATGFVAILTTEPALQPTPSNVVLYQGVALTALLVGQMILLDRFQAFLMVSLAGLQRETRKRTSAYRTLEREMVERRQLEHEVARASDEERRRLGQEVHDGVCQQIAAALLRSQALEQQLNTGRAPEPVELGALTSLLEEAIDEAHNVARGLWPLEPEPDALAPALRALVNGIHKLSAFQCEFITQGDVRVPDPVMAQHLYRIAQEAISNALRHSKGSRIVVRLSGRDSEILLEVQDDGLGMPTVPSHQGMGRRTMACRARMINGELTLTDSPGRGTRLVCRAPRLAPNIPEYPFLVAQEESAHEC